jgi:hypothetical protein
MERMPQFVECELENDFHSRPPALLKCGEVSGKQIVLRFGCVPFPFSPIWWYALPRLTIEAMSGKEELVAAARREMSHRVVPLNVGGLVDLAH